MFCSLLLRPGSGYDAALLHTLPADPGTQRCTIRHRLSDDILCALDRRLHIRYFTLRIDILLRLHRNRRLPLPRENVKRQRFQATLTGDHRTGATLRLIWTIDVLKLHRRLRFLDFLPQGSRQLSMLLDRGENRLLPLLQIPKITQTLIEGTQHIIVHRTRRLLAVTSDKRDRISLIDQSDDRLRLPGLQSELLRDFLYYFHI